MGHFKSGSDLHQLARPNTGAILRRFIPFPAIFNKLRPEREGAALSRFGWVNAASVFDKEVTLPGSRFAKTKERFGAIDVLRFEFSGRHPDVGSCAQQISFREVDKAFLIAAVGAIGLAGEADAVH